MGFCGTSWQTREQEVEYREWDKGCQQGGETADQLSWR